MVDHPPRLFTVRPHSPANGAQLGGRALETDHLGAEHDLDVTRPLDSVDEITRHAGVETRTADEQPHPRGDAGEIDDGLARGVSCADERNLLPGAEPTLDRRRPVVHVRALEVAEVRNLEPPVTSSAGDDHRASLDLSAVVQGKRQRIRRVAELRYFARDRHLDAEFLRLMERT